MEALKFSEKVKILPWVGTNYFSQKTKILILGESIYHRDSGVPLKDQANRYIEGVIDGWNVPFYNHIQEVVPLEDFDINNLSHRKEFWNSVAFYEYVQSVLAKNGRPDKKQWEDAKEPFIEIMKILRPHFVLAFGFQLYDNLPDIDGDKDGLYLRYGKERIYTWVYRVDDQPVVAIKLKHASRAFKSEHWRKIYHKVIGCYAGTEI